MTVGIGIAGPGAGAAALAALAMVERVGRGMIGGFVSLAAIDGDGRLHRAETQRGGSAGLFPGPPPDAIARAGLVALMSSGPDRMAPLSQFTPAAEGVGCMSGHRLPNMPGRPGGRAVNVLALERLAAGMPPQAALETVLADHPDADAGLIAVTAAGDVAAANGALAAARSDAGALVTEGAGLRIAILHNAIFPVTGLAAIAAGAAMDACAPADAADFEITLAAGVRLTTTPPRAVDIDDASRVIAIGGLPAGWTAPAWQGAAAMRGSPVRRAGHVVGTLVSEVYCVARHGIVESCDGGPSARLGVRATS